MPSLNPIQQLNVGEALGGASGAGVMKTDSNGLVLDPSTIVAADITNSTITSAKLAATAAGGGLLTGLPTPTDTAILATDTILQALAKLQGQINAINAP